MTYFVYNGQFKDSSLFGRGNNVLEIETLQRMGGEKLRNPQKSEKFHGRPGTICHGFGVIVAESSTPRRFHTEPNNRAVPFIITQSSEVEEPKKLLRSGGVGWEQRPIGHNADDK